MAQSMNTKVDLVVKGTSFHGLTTYGKIMTGDKAFEFYNEKNINDYIQIPWEEIDHVSASVMFKGKYIPRIAIHIRDGRVFSFAAKEPKTLLRAINQYIPGDRMLKSLTAPQVIGKRVKRLFGK